MNILEKITDQKRVEVQARKKRFPLSTFTSAPLFARSTLAFDAFLDRTDLSGIIAEFKRKSPSKGILNEDADAGKVAQGYSQYGASSLSVLTETAFFAGRDTDLLAVRALVEIPVLRKDFMLEEYQILESKALGADVVLLIAAVLKPEEIKSLAALSVSLGMQVLLEVHSLQELERSLGPNIHAIGVNNRNLETFEVCLDTSFGIAPHIPAEFKKISESGISDVNVIKKLRAAGFSGFLIGETFMKEKDPVDAFRRFVQELEA